MRLIREGEALTQPFYQDLFIDLRDPTPAQYDILGNIFSTYIESYEHLVQLVLDNGDFVNNYGKIGVIIESQAGKPLKILMDDNYENNPEYKAYINKNRFTPQFVNRANDRANRSYHITDVVDEKVKKMLRLREKLSFHNTLKKESGENYDLIVESVSKIKQKNGTNEQIKASIKQGLRLAELKNLEVKLKGRICIMTETTAKNPDKSHMFLEGRPIECGKLMKILSRFGCQHSFELLNMSESEKKLLTKS